MMKTIEIKHPPQYKEQPSGLLLNDPRLKGFVEGYAYALQDMILRLTGDDTCGKVYDPMTITDKMHSYAFNMKDGGRHHPLGDYEDVGEIVHILLEEAVDWIYEDYLNE